MRARLASLLLAAVLAGCSSGTNSPPTDPITVAIQPTSASLDACGTGAFVAQASSGGVVWSVAEVGGGTVQGGAYSAPATPGVYHVVATSQSDPARSARAVVTVGPERVLSVGVAPGSASTSPSDALAFSAIVTTSCGTFSAP